MKIKTSITLSDDLLKAIDQRCVEFRSRSEFLELAAHRFLDELARRERDTRDLGIINGRADTLNAEAEDVLGYQVPL